MKKQIAASLAIAALITACNVAPKILSVDDLVAALVDEGVAIDSQEPAPIPQGQHFRFDKGVTAKGQDLWIDVLQISDRKVFDIAKSAAGLLVVAEAAAGQEIPGKPETYARYPFVVIVRLQPQGANVLATLQELLPPEAV
jgi:hypothetical protein